jgi:hypothetical protein
MLTAPSGAQRGRGQRSPAGGFHRDTARSTIIAWDSPVTLLSAKSRSHVVSRSLKVLATLRIPAGSGGRPRLVMAGVYRGITGIKDIALNNTGIGSRAWRRT